MKSINYSHFENQGCTIFCIRQPTIKFYHRNIYCETTKWLQNRIFEFIFIISPSISQLRLDLLVQITDMTLQVAIG